MSDRRHSWLLWFAVAAPPLAWVLELVLGYGVDDAACAPASMRWGIDEHAWQAVLLVATTALAGAGLVAALASFRATHGAAGDPRGRAEFLAVTSLSAAAVFLLLTVMSGVGVLFLEECRG